MTLSLPADVRAAVAELDCVVLCGGLGTRLRQVVDDRSKSMATIHGRPFLAWLLLQLRDAGLRRVVLATGHHGDHLATHLGGGADVGMELSYSHEDTPLGTAGALCRALPATSGRRLLVVNGDTWFPVDVAALHDRHAAAEACATIALAHVDDCARYGRVRTGDDGAVVAFDEKGVGGPGWVSAGILVLERSTLETMRGDGPSSLERDVLPRLVGHGLQAVRCAGALVDIGTPESYRDAEPQLAPALDRLAARAPGARRVGARFPATEAAAHAIVAAHLDESIATQERVRRERVTEIAAAARLIADAFTAGHKVLLCGNGGSAADCQHVAAEFMSRLRAEVERAPLPAIALTTDTSFLTAYTNDYDYDGVFARQVDGLGAAGDVLVGISTSGGSRNVVRAVEAARRRGMRVVALTGDGGPLRELADVTVAVPSRSTQVIQECLLGVEHVICELVEEHLFGCLAMRTATVAGGSA